jgi:hypothetical protein
MQREYSARAPSDYVYGQPRRQGWLLRSAAAAGTAVLAGALLGSLVRTSQRERPARARAARSMHQGAALLSLSVLADSALEHYRASFEDRAMYIAPAISALALANSVEAARTPERESMPRAGIYAAATATGLSGLAFHVYNLLKRPSALHTANGSFNWLNLFYAAPLGAPLAIALAGAIGLTADEVQRTERRARATAMLTSAGLLGTCAEVGLLHFRGAFQNPFMYVPVSLPPLAAVALAATSARPTRRMRPLTRGLLRLTASIGLAGVGFHFYAMQRNMGGLRNWSQVLLQGPPVPAPPAFTGLALAGLGALDLLEAEHG